MSEKTPRKIIKKTFHTSLTEALLDAISGDKLSKAVRPDRMLTDKRKRGVK